jgi:acyl dehydratase
MPGVLIVEAMAQAGAVLMLSEMEDRHSKLAVFTGIDGAKFRRSVTPGDQLRIEVEVVSFPLARGQDGRQGIRRRQAGLRGHADLHDRAARPRIET